jgi:SagB-type dehydrogenase family enzyme
MASRKISIYIVSMFLTSVCFGQGYDFMVRQAEGKIADGAYQEALTIYEKALQSGEYHYLDYFNAARACAKLGRPDDAFTYLEKAAAAGLTDKSILEKEPDLENLRKDGRWEKALGAVQANADRVANLPTSHEEVTVIDLPQPRIDGSMSVEKALKNRRSIRSYKTTALTLEDLAQILWAGYGITLASDRAPAFVRGGLRAAPSAGARFPLDLYAVVWNVTGLEPGVYWYKSEKHQLVLIKKGDFRAEISRAAFDQPHFRTAAAAIVHSAIYERMMAKYGQRGRERYVCMDLGHSAENIYLQAVALGIGTCAIGAFDDMALRLCIGMTRDEEPLYIMPLGKTE